MNGASAPSWLPDWTNASAYPKVNEREFDWRWGFVRRNPNYQADWKRLVEPNYDPSDRSIGDGPSLEHFRTQFGLLLPPDPAFPGPAMWLQDMIAGGFPVTPNAGSREREQRFALGNFEVPFIVDLSRPIEGQIETIKIQSEKWRRWLVDEGMTPPVTAKHHRNKFPLYLRLLDAHVSGATHPLIGKILFPEVTGIERRRSMVRDGLKSATAMRDKRFREIRPERRNIEG